MFELLDPAEGILYSWQLPDNAPLGLARLLCRRNAMTETATGSDSMAVESAVILAVREHLRYQQGAAFVEVPDDPLVRQRILDRAVTCDAPATMRCIDALWAAVLEHERQIFEHDTRRLFEEWCTRAPESGWFEQRAAA